MIPGQTASQGANGQRPSGTIQLLVDDAGNRSVIERMLDSHFVVETNQSLVDADLFLIEDHLYHKYKDALHDQQDKVRPAFCPVVLIRRETTQLRSDQWSDPEIDEPILIDDVIEAPIDSHLLIRRLSSLLIRRKQSVQLAEQLSTLESREQSLRRFERGVESSGNGIVLTDTEGAIEYVNPAFTEMSGYALEESVGKSPRIFQPDGAVDRFSTDFWLTIGDREHWEGEIVIERKDTTRCITDTTVRAIRDESENLEGFVLVLNDITDRVEQETKLLEREGELNHLRQLLTRYLRHNLRNDLNLIAGFAQELVNQESLSHGEKELAKQIVEISEQLMAKSDTARTYSQLLERESALSTYDLSAVVSETVGSLKEQYPDVDWILDVTDGCEIKARGGITSAISELIENAAQYNDATSPYVSVEVQSVDGARLIIEDNGPGIPEAELASLDAGEETSLMHSEGVGLWLSKWIIEGMDGELTIDLLDTGTRVIVEFPPPGSVGDQGIEIQDVKEREERLETAIQRMTDAILEVDAEWRISFLDRRAEEILGVSAEEVLGQTLWDIFSSAHGTEFEEVYREAMSDRSTRQIEGYYEGTGGWLEIYVYPEFDGGLSFYFRDTTEQNRRKQALERAQGRMEFALNVTDATVWEYDVDTDTVTTHPDPHGIFGVVLTSGEDFIQEIHPDDRAAVESALEYAIESRTPFEAEYRVQTQDGVRWVEDYGELQQPDSDRATMIGISRDITKQKERHRRYEAIFNQTYQFTGLMEPDGTLIETNDTALEFGGITRDDVIGEKIWNSYWFRISKETQEQTKADVHRAANGEFVRREIEVRGNDGTAVIDFTIRPITDEEGTVVLLVPEGRDITEIKEREQQLQERIKELTAIHHTIRAFGDTDTPIDDILSHIVTTIPPSFKFPDITEARISYGEDEYATQQFQLTDRSLSSETDIEGSELRLEVVLTDDPPGDQDPFINEERQLLQTLLIIIENNVRRRISREELIRHQELLQHTERLAAVGGWEADVETGKQRWSEGTYRIHDIASPAAFDPTVDAGVDFYHQDDQETIASAVDRCMTAGESYDLELRLITAAGQLKWVHTTGEPVREHGEIVAIRGAIQDVTERVQKRKELERIRDFFAEAERLGDLGAWEVESDGAVRWSDGTYRVLGIEDDFEPTLEAGVEIFHPEDQERIEQAVSKAFDSGEAYDMEARVITGDGEQKWVRTGGVPIDGGHKLRGYVQDISRYKQTQQELVRSEERLELALEASDLGMWMLDLQTETSPVRTFRHDEIFGYDDALDYWSFDTFLEHVHPDHRERVNQQFEIAQETGDLQFECRIIREDGVQRWINAEGTFYFDEDGAPDRAIGTVEDVTEEKERDLELQRYQYLVDNAADPMYVLDEGGYIEMANTALSDTLGKSREDVIGSHVSDFMREGDVLKGTELVKELLRQDTLQSDTHEFRLKEDINGESIYETKVVVLTGDDGYTGSVGVIRDVTVREDRERTLQAERDLFDVILENSPVGITIIGADGTLEFVNERAEEIYGRSQSEIEEFTHDDSRWDLVNEAGESFADGETPFERVTRGESVSDQIVGLRRPSGERVWVSVNGAPILREDSSLEKAVFAFDDISEQRDLETRLAEILGRVTDAFYALDDAFRFTLVNERAEELLQATEEELLGEVLWEQYPEAAEVDEVWDAFHDAMETQTPQSYELYFEPLDFRVEANVFPSQTGVSVYFRDVTELREREEQLAQQNQRLEEFASIISHDLRNPLNVARGRLELAFEECETEHHDDIESALDRMETLIEDLLELARHGEAVGEREPIELAALLQDCWTNVETTDGILDIEVERTIDADKSRLQQVFENLFRNAVEHGGEGVTVTIGELDNGIYIEDDGPGILDAKPNEIFEAGYSTSDEGTGFGLSIVQEIVQAHGWEITVGEGSTGGARFEITGIEFV